MSARIYAVVRTQTDGRSSDAWFLRSGSEVFKMFPEDTVGSSNPMISELRASKPWKIFDFEAAPGSTWTLFEKDTVDAGGAPERRLYRVTAGGPASITVPAGHYRDVHRFHVKTFIQTYGGEIQLSILTDLFVAEGVGIIEEKGHEDSDMPGPGTSSVRTWEAVLTKFNP